MEACAAEEAKELLQRFLGDIQTDFGMVRHYTRGERKQINELCLDLRIEIAKRMEVDPALVAAVKALPRAAQNERRQQKAFFQRMTEGKLTEALVRDLQSISPENERELCEKVCAAFLRQCDASFADDVELQNELMIVLDGLQRLRVLSEEQVQQALDYIEEIATAGDDR